MFGIRDYDPTFYNTVEDFILNNHSKLKNLIGKKIKESFVIWELNDNEWHSDGVVVITLEDCNIEICNKNLNELSVTLDEIDLSIDLESYDCEEYGKIDFEWRKDNLEQLNRIKGRTIEEIEIINYRFKSATIYNKSVLDKVNEHHVDYLLNGIGFKLDEGYVSVFNNLDTNGISNDRETKSCQYLKVASLQKM